MRVAIALLLCWPLWVGAATYYVDSTAATGGDGSLAAPWDQFSDITGLSANDTICISGEFDETLTPGTTGTSGNPITYDFACDGVAAGSIVRTGNNNGVTITGDIEYITLQDPVIFAGARCVSMDQTTDTTQGHHRINNGTLSDCSTNASAGTSPAIYAATHDLIVDGTTISDVGDDGLRTGAAAGDITLQNCIIQNVDQRSGSGDAVQIGVSGGSGNLTIDNCTIRYNSDNKQAVLDAGSGALVIRNSRFDGQGSGDEAIGVNKTSGTCLIASNYFYDFDQYGIFADGASVGCTVQSNIFRSLPTPVYLKSDSTGTWNVENNTMDEVTGAVYSLGTQTINLYNNSIGCVTGAYCIREGSNTTFVGDYNSYEQEYTSAWYSAGSEYDTLSAWATAVSQESNSAVQAPQYVGGPNPTTAEGFKLKSTSPLIDAATCVYTTGCVPYDYGGRRARVPADIGAWQRN